ncbi:alpha/beta fold hydrolase [Peredibacter starrii]|uniref:Alpha/beta hydrolase n=1 Tax=Peredibacter starrii TaxID=28202 RepID=A0AAX4HLN0_9BACT|nr:alpha/beta hydrolase [Peredibacter starrii]WPU64212.1 alpha/beta hydrolase [Peredibacter starrii]
MISSFCVFLPGTLCDERIFQYQLREFPNHAVIDLRHSDSIEEMLELVRKLPQKKMTLIGFSMGGHVAQEFAIKYPERVEKLVVIAASGEGYPPEEKKLVLDTLPALEKGKFTGITDKRLKDYLAPASYENLEIRNTIHAMAGADAKEVYLRQLKATLERRNISADLQKVTLPMLYVAGEDDKIVLPSAIERTAKNPKNAKFESLNDCGHFVPLEQPGILNMILLDFIS